MVTKIEQLKEWAKQNVTLIDLLPNNNNLQVTTRLIDVLEDEVDERYYLSDEKVKKLTLNEDLSGRLNQYEYRQCDEVHSINKVSPTLNTMQGGDRQPKVAVPVLTPDRVNKRQNGRRFKEDGEPMFTLTAQDRHGVVTNDKNIRFTDDGFHTHRNDKKKSSIQGTHVTYKEGKTHALTSNHIPMTLDDIRIRKLSALECWRLQGFTDEQFYKAKNSGVSNSQLYKQAGNSVTVNVVAAIVSCL